ncbi:MAG TPA: replicative DNA helicase [Solirubrobacteraceae bacterium]|nr:replicative DNA helicase [Solirubrobacteraceae bacterium]
MSAVQTIAVPPHNLDAEKSVLGAVLLDERHLHGLVVEEQLRPEHFYDPGHGLVFEAMLELYEGDGRIDHLTVAERLREKGKLEEAGGPGAIEELAGWVPAAGHAREYGRIVRDNARLRALLRTSYDIQARVLARDAPARDLVEQAERSVLEIATDERQRRIRSISDILHEETDKLHRLSVSKTPLTGIPSGFRDLDEKTGGFQPGNLIVIAARPSMGKSALVANIAENAALAGHAVALFSLEMSESELAQRFVASQARLRGEDLRRGRVPARKWPEILEACDRLSRAPLFVDDTSDTSVLDVRAKSRRLHAQIPDGLGLIIVDYLQLMRHEGRVDSRVEQVGQISRGLKQLARELNVPVIALSQLSRAVEQRGGDRRPVLSDLRECVTGDTPVWLADGRRMPIAELVGTSPTVLALHGDGSIAPARSDAVWAVGPRPVLTLRLASGRTLRATAEHRVLSDRGWTRLCELGCADRVALAAGLPEPAQPLSWPDARAALVGRLLGDGGVLGGPGRTRVPRAAFRLKDRQVALLLCGIWETCGRIEVTGETRIACETPSEDLARDLAALLLRLGIVARISARGERGQKTLCVDVPDAASQARFLERIAARLARAVATLGTPPEHAAAAAVTPARRNAAALPAPAQPSAAALPAPARRSAAALPAPLQPSAAELAERVLTHRPDRALDPASQRTAAEVGDRVGADARIRPEASAHVAMDAALHWDPVVAVEPCGVEPVFDLTVPGPASWLADGLVSHNSGQIEQDADLVMFIYRDDYYNPPGSSHPSERQGEADIIIAKHRNGPTGDVVLTFRADVPKFANYAGDRFRE